MKTATAKLTVIRQAANDENKPDWDARHALINDFLRHLETTAELSAIAVGCGPISSDRHGYGATLLSRIDALRPVEHETFERIREALPQSEKDNLFEMRHYQSQAAFCLGMLAGAKMAGYSPAQLERLAAEVATATR